MQRPHAQPPIKSTIYSAAADLTYSLAEMHALYRDSAESVHS